MIKKAQIKKETCTGAQRDHDHILLELLAFGTLINVLFPWQLPSQKLL